MECHLLRVIFVLDYQVNNLGDVQLHWGAIYIVDQNCSRQSMSPYVLQPYKFDVNEHPCGS